MSKSTITPATISAVTVTIDDTSQYIFASAHQAEPDSFVPKAMVTFCYVMVNCSLLGNINFRVLSQNRTKGFNDWIISEGQPHIFHMDCLCEVLTNFHIIVKQTQKCILHTILIKLFNEAYKFADIMYFVWISNLVHTYFMSISYYFVMYLYEIHANSIRN